MTYTLLSRSYCGLCHEMERLAREDCAKAGIELRVIDIDDDEEGMKYLPTHDELVPALFDSSMNEICHWHYDAEAFARSLSKGA